mmetsp:Transcript_650/g.1074  ORF Transcript_650/g.1074 Transcript_650/m.1074 type:complete len:91 (-) Transcript_650:1267-1539(-)
MYELAEKFVAFKESLFPSPGQEQGLLQVCTASSSSSVKGTLMGNVCYDREGCCGDAHLSSASESAKLETASSVGTLSEKAKSSSVGLSSK